MASKKCAILLGIFALIMSSISVSAQVGATYDWRDSSLIPANRMPQHNEFLNNQYNFPAKPRNQWEVGIKGGLVGIAGDVPSVMPTFGFGAHVRKAFGYVFSMRVEYMHGTAKGLSWSGAENYMHNTAWINNGYLPAVRDANGLLTPAQDKIFYNYKASLNDLGIQGIVNLNNIRFHKAKNSVSIYGFGGVGITWYKTKVNALDGSGNKYDFSGIAGGSYSDRKDTKKALKDLMDDSYETDAESYGNTRMKLFGETARPSGTIGVGLAFKLSKRINLALEDRQTFIKDDLIDGQQWQEHPMGDPVLTSNFDSYNYLTIGLNFNLGGKSVEPLWWLNPLDYAYSELNAPKHMKLPKPVLDDADGDGVTDQFDNEPNTPAGCPVDSHGVSRDTDGDGVPDCKDKELITPTQCQPVDADGVGKCPDPECCKNMVSGPVNNCQIGDLPSVSFAGKSVKLSKDAEGVLATVADKMRNNPNCKVVVQGYAGPSKSEQQLSWDRVNTVINYLVEKQGISSDRLIFKYGETGGDPNTIDLRAAQGDEGPNTVPAPHPNLRKSK